MMERQPIPPDERAIIEASTLEESLERADRIAGVTTLFRRGMDRITQPAGFNDYLHLQARFPDQPFFNVLLLLDQFPDATKIASSHRWAALGRPLRPAEQGIWQFVPYEREVGVDGGGESIQELVGVGVETVYDITQTKGPIHREEERPPVSAIDVQGRIVEGLLERSNNRIDRQRRPLVAVPPTRQSGQLGLDLSVDPVVEIELESNELPALMEVVRTRLMQRGRLPTAAIEPVTGVVASILMIRHGVDLGEVWMPEMVAMIDRWSPAEPNLTEAQHLLALV